MVLPWLGFPFYDKRWRSWSWRWWWWFVWNDEWFGGRICRIAGILSRRHHYTKAVQTFWSCLFLVTLFRLKALGGWTNTSFTLLLETLKKTFPKDNKVPLTMYDAKKTLGTLDMKYEKFHACPNDCVLYRHEYEDLDEFLTCKQSRSKKGKMPCDDIKGVPVKVRFILWL